MSMFNDIVWKMMRIVFECRKSQELRSEILARTLDILGSRVGMEVVWQFFSRSEKAVELYTRE